MPEGSRLISWFNWIAPEAAAGGGMWVYVHRHWTDYTIQQRRRQLLHFFVIIHTAQPSQRLNVHIKTIMLHISVFVRQKSRGEKKECFGEINDIFWCYFRSICWMHKSCRLSMLSFLYCIQKPYHIKYRFCFLIGISILFVMWYDFSLKTGSFSVGMFGWSSGHTPRTSHQLITGLTYGDNHIHI